MSCTFILMGLQTNTEKSWCITDITIGLIDRILLVGFSMVVSYYHKLWLIFSLDSIMSIFWFEKHPFVYKFIFYKYSFMSFLK